MIPILDNASVQGWMVISEEALPSCATSTAIFANAPAYTKLILLTLRAQGITMRFDGSAATASANGTDWAVNSTTDPYMLALSPARALNVRAIQQGATATGWIQYLRPGN